MESGTPAPKPARFTVRPVADQVRDFAYMKSALGQTQILDARSSSRFTAEEKEPRPGVRSGHMPGAVNVHYRGLLNDDGTLKSDAELRRLFAEKGVDLRGPIVTSCGSGVTASIVMLALAQLGAPRRPLFMTAPGRNGAAAPRRRSRPASRETDKVAPRRIAMTVTFLEMTAKPSVLPPPSPRGRHAILRSENPPPHFYRYLYDTIGDKYFWVDRRKVGHDKLAEIIHAPPIRPIYSVHGQEIPPAWRNSTSNPDSGSANIAYFGLMPEAQGRHLSFFFLYHTCINAWVHPITRLTVNTTAPWTPPRALPLYQRMGFVPYSREERFVELLEGQKGPA